MSENSFQRLIEDQLVFLFYAVHPNTLISKIQIIINIRKLWNNKHLYFQKLNWNALYLFYCIVYKFIIHNIFGIHIILSFKWWISITTFWNIYGHRNIQIIVRFHKITNINIYEMRFRECRPYSSNHAR